MQSSQSSAERPYEIIPGRVYYVALRANPRQTAKAHYFSTDNELVYWNFFLDFGPLNLGQLFRFCQKLNSKLNDRRLADKKIYYYSSTHSHRRTNSVTMICAYSMLYLGLTPEEAFAPFKDAYPPFPPFHDASPCVCTYKLTILGVLRGIYKARETGFFSFDMFDCDEYEHFEKVENGDLSWIAYNKICAFAGPHNTHNSSAEGYLTLTPEDYIPYFKKKKVGLVVRLNKKYYDEGRFIRAGIRHKEFYYLDGSTPPDHLLHRVIDSFESEPNAIAVHCKAGLGRTGTCIGCWAMKHYGFTAEEIIGWLRVCRPGSVIGPQQHYLQQMQPIMWRLGDEMRAKQNKRSNRKQGSSGSNVNGVSYGVSNMTISDSDLAAMSQGDHLRSRKSPQGGKSPLAGRGNNSPIYK